MKFFPYYSSPSRFFEQVGIALLLTIVLSLASGGLASKASFAQRAIPANYSCGNGISNHCYSFYRWWGAMNGAETNINIPFLGNRGQSDGFTNWEIWVAQLNNSGCSDQQNACWIEAGLSTGVAGPSGPLGSYYWSDERPGGGYNNHLMYQVGPDDRVETLQIYRQDSRTWNIHGSVWSCGGTCSSAWGGQSTNNNFSPEHIDLGLELSGSYGQPNAGSDWQFNYWRCGNSWCKQSGLGNPGSGTSFSLGAPAGPTVGYWNTQPNSTGNTGDWFASCVSC